MPEALALHNLPEHFDFPVAQQELEITLLMRIVKEILAVEQAFRYERDQRETRIAEIYAVRCFDARANPSGLTEPEFRLLRFEVKLQMEGM